MTKILHGSMSLVPIDELAAEYVIRLRNGGNVAGTPEYYLCRRDLEQMCRRIGYENAVELIKKASETYDLLVPADPA